MQSSLGTAPGLVAMTVKDGFDDAGGKWAELQCVKNWTHVPMKLSRTKNTTCRNIQGLAGARGISIQAAEG